MRSRKESLSFHWIRPYMLKAKWWRHSYSSCDCSCGFYVLEVLYSIFKKNIFRKTSIVKITCFSLEFKTCLFLLKILQKSSFLTFILIKAHLHKSRPKKQYILLKTKCHDACSPPIATDPTFPIFDLACLCKHSLLHGPPSLFFWPASHGPCLTKTLMC